MSDLIKREDAIEAVANADETNGTVKVFSGLEIIDMLNALPSAEPQWELISREDALKIISNRICDNKWVCECAINSLPTAEPTDNWIPVSERLPENKEGTYWVCTDEGSQCECRWTNDVFGLGSNKWSDWGWKIIDKPQHTTVIAWQPLSTPYKGE